MATRREKEGFVHELEADLARQRLLVLADEILVSLELLNEGLLALCKTIMERAYCRLSSDLGLETSQFSRVRLTIRLRS